jgi:hypothetical protein
VFSTLPLAWHLAHGVRPDRDLVLGEVFGSAEELPIDRLGEWLASLDVSTRFRDHGAGAAEVAEIIEQARLGPRGRNFIA